ncbi:MAG: hypothetical protein WCT02_01030 [Candidatus Paceibacterota bacterium]|jgi:hypothetical protein
MTTATLEKVNIKNLEQFVPKTDYLEMKNIPSSKDWQVLEISVKNDNPDYVDSNNTDDFVDLEITLRKGKRVGFFRE